MCWFFKPPQKKESSLYTWNPNDPLFWLEFWTFFLEDWSPKTVDYLRRLNKKNDNWTTVVGFNPFEKYLSKWEYSPNRGENKKYLEPPPSGDVSQKLLAFGALVNGSAHRGKDVGKFTRRKTERVKVGRWCFQWLRRRKRLPWMGVLGCPWKLVTITRTQLTSIFWRSTPQNKAFSNQNKGHLGSRYS